MKTAATIKSTSKQKKIKEFEVSVPVDIDISKLGCDKVDIKWKEVSDRKLQSLILPGDTLPVVELDRVDPTEGDKDVPSPDALEAGTATSTLDEETKTTAETLEALQRQPSTADFPGHSSLPTPPAETEYFEGDGLLDV